jgi:hypothetical protein
MNATNKNARVAGLLYLTIIVSGIFAEFFVRQSLVVPGDATATATNILAAESLFRSGIAGDLIMIMSDIALALLFYVLLKPVNNALSLLAAFFRLIQAAVLGANLLNLFAVLELVRGADYLTGFSTDQLYAQVLFYLEAHGVGYSIGLLFFAMNCLVFGYLVFRSGYFPKLLGILLIIAGFGYLTDGFANVLLTNYNAYEETFALVVFLPAIVGELAMCLWLLIRGIGSQTPSLASTAANTKVSIHQPL